MSDETPDLTALRLAISDPGAVTPRRDGESITHWSARAVHEAGFGPVRAVEAERDNWRDKANEAGAAYGLANQKHHEELDRANRLEGMCDRLAGRLADVHGAAEMLNRYRARAESAEAALAGLREGVKALASQIESGVSGGLGGDRSYTLANIATRLRALLPTPDREEARDE